MTTVLKEKAPRCAADYKQLIQFGIMDKSYPEGSATRKALLGALEGMIVSVEEICSKDGNFCPNQDMIKSKLCSRRNDLSGTLDNDDHGARRWQALWNMPEHDYEPIRAAEAAAADRRGLQGDCKDSL